MTLEQWCDYRNQQLWQQRADIEWAPGKQGPYLRDREAFTAHNTRIIADRDERERNEWLRAQRHAAMEAEP